MDDLNILNHCFDKQSLGALKEIFLKAKACDCVKTMNELQWALESVLRREASSGARIWRISSGSGNHLFVLESMCMLINVYGVHMLFENVLFLDGEMAIENVHWIARDHLVVFDTLYIVRGIRKKCICHFAKSDFFVYFVPDQAPELPFNTILK